MNGEIIVEQAIRWARDDGGRAAAGFKNDAGDCATRAVAIALGLPYQQVYADLWAAQDAYACAHNNRAARRIRHEQERGRASPRNGMANEVLRDYLRRAGWAWVPIMGIGTGCKVHLRASELPMGRIIVKLSGHVAAVLDRELHDTHDCSRAGTRCVYGYWTAKES